MHAVDEYVHLHGRNAWHHAQLHRSVSGDDDLSRVRSLHLEARRAFMGRM
jgi:hypothetical protein